MGLLSDWIGEMGNTWNVMGEGDAKGFMGVPQETRGNTGHQATPDANAFTPRQKKMLHKFFLQQFGRYPLTEYEFQQWLQDNW